ncbi:hypothetical protein BCR39DRAFT_521378 [Naematelia encephala]|uniref:Uncharacterized protein n=1 Tax=Naematelia encephala TaxID=71784 RepID=A0A1Y2BE70_9TREE|nr:hypothetical protein BCR39DRAFT_521378 [Naematelia encephala]
MLLDSTTSVTLPQIISNPPASFYSFPISSRTRVHTSIRGLAPSSSSSASGGPGPATQERQREKNACERALRRALVGQRPAGVALGREGEDLSDEEEALGAENQMVTQFGHRFLLPIGRRLTQMEMDAAASPTPSQPDDERRQEDRNVASVSPLVGGQPVLEGELEGEEGGEVVDLDASIEDLDASGDIEDLDEGDVETEGESMEEE